LIPAPPGIVARFKIQDGDRTDHDEKPVIAFDNDGMALVLDERQGFLTRAKSFQNFAGLSHAGHSDYTTLIPAGGWRVEYTDTDGSKSSEPLTGWALKSNGDVVALTTDATGYVDDLQQYGGEFRIYHPDATEAEPSGDVAS
jgi:hypothetical protein